MHVPFVDLPAQYRALKTEIDGAIATVIEETAFIRGRFVSDFEKAFAKAAGAKHCIGCANGTDAIFIALKMLGVGPGDEVITAANSWIATSESVTMAGATPVFVDVSEDRYVLDESKIEAAITPRTKAIIPVHLYGQSANMDVIVELCRRHNLLLIEDCAQAHLATFKGRPVGVFGNAGTFSFYPGKNLGAYGDAGCMVTNDDALADRLQMYANHGARKKPDHEIEGMNSRLDGLQAAILLAKLPHLAEWTRLRQRHAARYNELLAGIPGVRTPVVPAECGHVFHVYCIQSDRRDALQAHLKAQGVETARHYPVYLPFLKAYAHRNFAADAFPVARRQQERILSLPMFAELTDEQIGHVCRAIREFHRA